VTDRDAGGARTVLARVARVARHGSAGGSVRDVEPAQKREPARDPEPAQEPGPGPDGLPRVVSGALLSGRYRLQALLPGQFGAVLWRSTDEVLGREVSVLAVGAVDVRAQALLAAARRAATAVDQHFLRVYDADEDEPSPGHRVVYVVQEWVSGRSLTNLLAGGPVDPQRAALLTRELAEAVAAVHDAGLTHRLLTPDRVLVSATGAVRIVGLEVAAALAGVPAAGPSADRATDVRALGALLYAGLTGRWPLADEARWPADSVYRIREPRRTSVLPPAPRRHGRVLGPRQVRPGIPRSLDLLALRALGRAGATSTISSARELAGLLGEVTAPAVDANTPLPQLRELAATALLPAGTPSAALGLTVRDMPRVDDRGAGGAPGAGGSGAVRSYGSGGVQPADVTVRPDLSGMSGPAIATAGTGLPERAGAERAELPRTRGVRVAAVAVLALVGLGAGLLAWQSAGQFGVRGPAGLVRDARPPASDGPGRQPAAAVARLAVASVRDFDPEGSDRREDPGTVGLATDSDPATAWRTGRYASARLGGLKSGVGLLVDLGKVQSVAEVDVGLVGDGTDLELRSAGLAAAPPVRLSDLQVVAAATGAGAGVRLRPPSPVVTRYLLVWLTGLPRDGSWYRGGVRTLAVRG